MEKVQHEKSATWEKCSMKITQHEQSATGKECNMKRVQYENAELNNCELKRIQQEINMRKVQQRKSVKWNLFKIKKCNINRDKIKRGQQGESTTGKE